MIGTVLRSRYELTGALADGPIFTTYSARDRQLGREVCVRLLKPPFNHEIGFIDKLRGSVRKIAGIHTSGVEALSDVEESEGNVYIVGELTRGPSLADRIRKLAPFSVPVSVGMAISIAAALDSLHKAGVVHGDLSSQNIAVLGDGEARLQMAGVWEAYSGSSTAGMMVLPAMAPYLAPEISEGDSPHTQSDVYAVGILLYELLSGRHPYYADTALATASRHRSQPTPNVRVINPSVPEVLDEIVKKAMAKDPADRYRSAGDLLTDLRLVQDALRFGKALAWPLRTEGKAKAKPIEPQPVTPRMSALRTQEEVEDLPRRARQDRDVPVWMLVIMTALGAVVLSLVGIWVMFNMNKPRLLTVPNLRGMSVEEARAMLQTSKLELRITQRIPNEQVPADHIVDTSPEANRKVRENGQVLATVSLGSKMVEMPDVRGMTLDKAKSVLAGLDLDVELPVSTVPSSTVGIGIIARQSPSPRAKLERLSRVRLFVSGGASSGPDEEPTDVMYQYTVRMTVSQVPEPVMVKITITDPESPEGRVIFEERRAAGEDIVVEAQSRAQQATFTIYYDDEEVKRVQETAEGARRQ